MAGLLFNHCYQGDCRSVLQTLPDESVQCVVTSPPYWGLRDYGVAGQIGLEPTPNAYVAQMTAIFREVRRILKTDGTCWINLGDSYSSGGRTTQVAPTLRGNGHDEASGKQAYLNNFAVRPGPVAGIKPKDLIGIPWRIAFALQADGWYLRQDIIWHKPNPMPESVRDRCTKAHEYLFLLAKSERYYFDADSVAEPSDPENWRDNSTVRETPPGQTRQSKLDDRRGKVKYETRNKRSVWTVTTKPFSGAHFATFPPALIEPCILAGARTGDVVLDPFMGAGTVAHVAQRLGRQWVGIELNPEYIKLQKPRTAQAAMVL